MEKQLSMQPQYCIHNIASEIAYPRQRIHNLVSTILSRSYFHLARSLDLGSFTRY